MNVTPHQAGPADRGQGGCELAEDAAPLQAPGVDKHLQVGGRCKGRAWWDRDWWGTGWNMTLRQLHAVRHTAPACLLLTVCAPLGVTAAPQ